MPDAVLRGALPSAATTERARSDNPTPSAVRVRRAAAGRTRYPNPIAGTAGADDASSRHRDVLPEGRKKWIAENYPKSMQVPGAPMITERRSFGTRHVPGRSPWGGYDISHTAVDLDRIVEGTKPIRPTPDFPVELARTATAPGIGLGD